MAWTPPVSATAGTVALAAWFNTYVRDNLKAIGDPWTSYTPTWGGSTTNPVIGNGTIAGAYMLAGKLCHYRLLITMGSTTTYGSGYYTFTLPTTSATGYSAFGAPLGTGFCLDTSAGTLNYFQARKDNNTRVILTTATGTNVTNASPYTWATGDQIEITGTFEAA